VKFWNHSKDVERERLRYDLASSQDNPSNSNYSGEGYIHFPVQHIPPFEKYYSWIEEEIVNVKDVLEIGAGTGQHTRPVVTPFTRVTALDISAKSLEVLRGKFASSVETIVGNIEELPFPDSSFDLIISCGVLSYGDSYKVDNEILRTLRPGGAFIFIDSLNHNPIFKLNRWIRFLRGNRSLSTVLRIPKMTRIEKLSESFDHSRFSFFGNWIWLHQILSSFLSATSAMRIYNSLEDSIGGGRYSFKIVVMLKGRKL
jgi:SAM-dependent methyltransferase